MLDTPTLQCNRVSFCRSAVVQNRQQIFKFASIGHGAPPVFDHRPGINSGGYFPVGNTASLAMAQLGSSFRNAAIVARASVIRPCRA
jgi:hypothetical protein